MKDLRGDRSRQNITPVRSCPTPSGQQTKLDVVTTNGKTEAEVSTILLQEETFKESFDKSIQEFPWSVDERPELPATKAEGASSFRKKTNKSVSDVPMEENDDELSRLKKLLAQTRKENSRRLNELKDENERKMSEMKTEHERAMAKLRDEYEARLKEKDEEFLVFVSKSEERREQEERQSEEIVRLSQLVQALEKEKRLMHEELSERRRDAEEMQALIDSLARSRKAVESEVPYQVGRKQPLEVLQTCESEANRSPIASNHRLDSKVTSGEEWRPFERAKGREQQEVRNFRKIKRAILPVQGVRGGNRYLGIGAVEGLR
eukprot:TRINITY_DN6534_c0_g1_i1.p1 TRINITY_DN6534_c0_g1~~TRINITY_DN6534_c0_g1_i1.p1  ORF type:complete len:320 (-),score=92.96 TRINITY_DN6534_c0_g1_i1:62-1021(-)